MEEFLSKAMATHGDAVYRLALCRLQNISDVEDVYQEVFLRLLKVEGAADWDEDHLKAWLIRVTLNRCADIGRFRIRRRTLPLSDVIEDMQPDMNEGAELWDAVARLPAKLRTPIHLHYVEGYSAEEIGQILKVPSATVRTRLYRARLKLKDTLGGYCDEEILSADHESNSCARGFE